MRSRQRSRRQHPSKLLTQHSSGTAGGSTRVGGARPGWLALRWQPCSGDAVRLRALRFFPACAAALYILLLPDGRRPQALLLLGLVRWPATAACAGNCSASVTLCGLLSLAPLPAAALLAGPEGSRGVCAVTVVCVFAREQHIAGILATRSHPGSCRETSSKGERGAQHAQHGGLLHTDGLKLDHELGGTQLCYAYGSPFRGRGCGAASGAGAATTPLHAYDCLLSRMTAHTGSRRAVHSSQVPLPIGV